jgi:hypothetical protein
MGELREPGGQMKLQDEASVGMIRTPDVAALKVTLSTRGAHFVRDSNTLSEGCLVEGAASGNMTKSIQVVHKKAGRLAERESMCDLAVLAREKMGLISTQDEIQVKPISSSIGVGEHD